MMPLSVVTPPQCSRCTQTADYSVALVGDYLSRLSCWAHLRNVVGRMTHNGTAFVVMLDRDREPSQEQPPTTYAGVTDENAQAGERNV